ncbi:large ribosomal subunit protein bL20m [Cloeon dipterum]|uniref:large ribosomal subunit protein bL20m n=1 Tax=Cloeon dipterum TaxID=197152 RepID=UPI00321FA7BC
MVFLSVMRQVGFRFTGTHRGPDKFWRRRKFFKMTAHFVGRKRNCYRIAIKYVHRAMVFATKDRKLKKETVRDLWETRLEGACMEHNFTSKLLLDSLSRQNVLLNRKSLSNLAIWEPRTFQSLMNIAWVTAAQERIRGADQLGPAPKNVFVPKIEDEVD